MVRPRHASLSSRVLPSLSPAPSAIRSGGIGALADSAGQYIPGFHTSAAFLQSLSANLRIPDDDLLPSPMTTPSGSVVDLRCHPSPSLLPTARIVSFTETTSSVRGSMSTIAQARERAPPEAADPLAGIPPLGTKPAQNDDDRVEALRLVADSVAQQRQVAGKAVILHPLTTAVMVGLIAVVYGWLYKGSRGDLAYVGTTSAGFIMAILLGVRLAIGGYLSQAESISWSWLDPSDDVLITWFGDEAIGTVVVRWASSEGKSKKKKGKRGLIKAWTVKSRYRGKGVGSSLLEEAVDLAHAKGSDGLEFDAEHVHARRVLPSIFNRVFDRRDDRALAALQDARDKKAKPGRRRS